jgi:hypothetical protein
MIQAMRQLTKIIRHILMAIVCATALTVYARPSGDEERWNQYLNIGSNFYFEGQSDSAKVYLEEVFESDTEKKITAARYLLDIALSQGDTLKINEYALFLAENYDATLNQERKQARRRYYLIGAGALLVLLVMGWLLRRQLKANDQQRKAFNQQSQIYDQQRQAYDKERQAYDQQLNEAQTAIERQTYENLLKQTREILSRGNQRKRILDAFNEAYPHVFERLKTTYPDLSEQEYDLLILNFMEFRIKEEAEIMELSQNTVMKYRSNLLKKVGKDPIAGLLKSLVLFIILFLTVPAFAQHKTMIHGNLGVENVNISILNTQYGTSTNAKGRYALPIYDRTKQINLYYSCVGYQDTIVSLMPKQLERDSINISFRMRKQQYNLQEVGVTASRDFYRSKRGHNIADMAFLDGNIYLLENKPKTSSMVVLDLEGTEKARADYDKLYEKLYIDCFNDVILVGQDSCLQVYLDERDSILPVSVFSRDFYRDKLLRIVCEFNGAYIIKTAVYDKGLFWLKYNHGKSQDFAYVLKDDPDKEQRQLCSFLDTIGFLDCQSQWMAIQAEYHQVVAEEGGIDLLNEGIWDGYMVSLGQNGSLLFKIHWYCAISTKKEFSITTLIFNDFLQFVDLVNREIVEINKDFEIASRRMLTVTSGEKYFKNEFLKDEATGNAYGLFIQDGVNYLGLYNTSEGTVGMGQKASKVAYPKVFKVNDGYAYSVSYDKSRNQGVIGRVKIK